MQGYGFWLTSIIIESWPMIDGDHGADNYRATNWKLHLLNSLMLMVTENYARGDYNWWAAMHSTAAFSVPEVTGCILFLGVDTAYLWNFRFHMSLQRISFGVISDSSIWKVDCDLTNYILSNHSSDCVELLAALDHSYSPVFGWGSNPSPTCLLRLRTKRDQLCLTIGTPIAG